jgi:hypothetical protein
MVRLGNVCPVRLTTEAIRSIPESGQTSDSVPQPLAAAARLTRQTRRGWHISS